MSNDLNRCEFIGRLGQAPETRYTTSGKAVASFSIACGSQWKDKETGEKKESVEWINCTAFDKLAEIIGEYLVKGSQVYVSGKMKTDKYQDKETGKDRYSTKVIVDTMQMLGGKRDGDDSKQAEPSQERDGGSLAPRQPQKAGAFDNFDDDCPF